MSTLRRLVGCASSESSHSRLSSSSSISAGSIIDVGLGHLAQLADLGIGEGGLGGPAAAEHEDLLHGAVGQGVDRVLGGVGDLQLLAGEGEHPGDVGGDVAVADHHHPLAAEVEFAVGEVGVGVVPVDELGGRVAAGQVLALDPEVAIDAGPIGEEDGVIALLELGDGDVAADLDVAEEAELRPGGGLLVDPDHRLDLRVVGGDPGADQPVGGRKPVEHVDLDRGALVLEQVLGRVEARRPRADDGDAQGCSFGTEQASRKG